MRNCKILNMIMTYVIKNQASHLFIRNEISVSKCDGFLCTYEGLCTDKIIKAKHMSSECRDNIFLASCTVLLTVGNSQDIAGILLPTIEATGQSWADCFDRRQVNR